MYKYLQSGPAEGMKPTRKRIARRMPPHLKRQASPKPNGDEPAVLLPALFVGPADDVS